MSPRPGTVTPTATGPNTTVIMLGTLGALADLGLIIAGLQYLVNKDGDLVKDPNRVNGGVAGACAGNDGAAVNVATNGERGMNASTGVAELPPGLVALLILSIVGAAGHVLSRRGTV
ncbi:hypothetical protein MHJ86_04515 [Corynebacterium afermentans]|nr:hypothetical protein [Corynebacterium afermentans]